MKQAVKDEICEPLSINQKPIKNVLRGEQLKAELTSRRESYVRNAKAANAC